MGNSSYTIQSLSDDASTIPDLAPALATGGFSDSPALSIANDTMTAMLMGTPGGEPFNWKWNRIQITPFFINSWQQDYFVPGLVNLGWLESCYAVLFNTTTYPKPVRVVEVRRDLLVTTNQVGSYAKICWMQNNSMIAGTWGVTQALSAPGLQNPGPGVVYTDPNGQTTLPANPITQVKDAFNNLWVVTTYGTCGSTNPFATDLAPVYPTLDAPTTTATTVTDGSVVWTAINPWGQGFRINPQPAQTGPIWQIHPVAQARIPKFTQYGDFLNPVPDDFYSYFKQGFFAQCYRRNPDPKIRARFDMEWRIWFQSLDNAVKQGSREMDDWGFIPGSNVMETGYGCQQSPARPYGPWY